MMESLLGFIFCLLSGIFCFWLFSNASTGLKNLKLCLSMYTLLFVISLIVFGYLMYVLIKPEKF